MKLPGHIQFSRMEPSDALEASTRDHAHKLESFAADIMARRVAVDLQQKHQHQGRRLGVRIDLTLSGHELVVNRVQDEDVYGARLDDGGSFGFIRTPDGNAYYFDRDDVAGTTCDPVQTGSCVRFIPQVGGEGWQARPVSPGKHSMG